MSSPFHLGESEWNQLIANSAGPAQARSIDDVIEELDEPRRDDAAFNPDQDDEFQEFDQGYDIGVGD